MGCRDYDQLRDLAPLHYTTTISLGYRVGWFTVFLCLLQDEVLAKKRELEAKRKGIEDAIADQYKLKEVAKWYVYFLFRRDT